MEHRRAFITVGRRHAPRGAALAARRAPGAGRARGAPLPDGRPHVGLRVGVRAPLRGGRLRGLPARHPRHRLVRGDRDRRVHGGRARRHLPGDRLARRAGVVERPRRDVRHLVVGLQLAPGRLPAPAGARTRSRRSTPPTTATPTTSTTWAARSRRSTSSTTSSTWSPATRCRRCPRCSATAGARSGSGGSTTPSRGCCAGSRSRSTGRTGGTARCGPDYDRIACPTMIVAGWADGYTNIVFRGFEALSLPEARDPRPVGPRLDGHRAAGAAHRPRPGADPLVPPLARRRAERRRRGAADRGLRAPLDACRRRISPRCAASGAARRPGRRSGSREQVLRPEGEGTDTIHVRGDVGQTAWISCAGQLPWGLPDDQRVDDALSLTYDWEPLAADLDVMGHPRVRLTVTSPVPVAYVSAKLCDVFPDGTSALAGRGLLNLTHRDGPRRTASRSSPASRPRSRSSSRRPRGSSSRATACGSRSPAPTGRTSGRRRAVRRCRSSARASSSCCRCSTGRRRCPRRCCRRRPARTRTRRTRTTSSRRRSGGSRTTRSAHESRCVTGSGSNYEAPFGARVEERYEGTVGVSKDDPALAWARGRTVYRITWPEADVRTEATLDLRSDAEAYHVVITLDRRGARAGGRRDGVLPRAAVRAVVRAAACLTHPATG